MRLTRQPAKLNLVDIAGRRLGKTEILSLSLSSLGSYHDRTTFSSSKDPKTKKNNARGHSFFRFGARYLNLYEPLCGVVEYVIVNPTWRPDFDLVESKLNPELQDFIY